MISIGRQNTLSVLRMLPRGAQLDGGRDGEILLPKQYIKDPLEVGDQISVFIYRDSQDRLVATTLTPMAQVGEFAYLNVVDENKHGVFLNWGLPKDIFVPFAEQRTKLEKGRKALVRIYLDDTRRIAASAKIDDFLYDMDENQHFKAGEKVSVMVAGRTDLGVKVIVDHAFWGLIYHSDVFEELRRGDVKTAYIKRLRPDHKLEISLQAPGFKKAVELTDKILEALEAAGGHLPLGDKSDPNAIKQQFGCSKSTFKQAIGSLYKARKIRIEPKAIYLIEA